ncbi:tyrosine-type recombinase/integrase [Halorarum salinum]|uniref:Site-specific integrase n=1 Tax=Halorarum salinum TaxID=2743089 RepID=A0A7D5LAB3_9EURY|nr:site-specific integrase [Halobaculum salinum]QLG61912.1 site-specific integrase [Halobaculum salinum]
MDSNATHPDLERKLRRILYETGVAETNAADLVPRGPHAAVDEYLDTNPEGNLPSTMRSHAARLAHFSRWCSEYAEIDDLNALDGPDLEAYKTHQTDLGYAPRTLESQLETLSVFLRFCRQQDYVRSELPYLVPDVDVVAADETRDRLLERDRAETIIGHLATFRYASREHIVWLLVAEKGLRICTLLALDLQDYSPPTQNDEGYLELHNRPTTGTRLKNGDKSERQVTVPPAVCDTLDDYLQHQRVDATDEYGREPLLSTANGRIASPTIRTYINKWTAPCAFDGECPHGEIPAECRAAQQTGNMECPSKRSPHDVRRGYITHLRRYGVPKEIISDEVDASVAVLDHHYDKTTKEEQRQMRTAAIDAVLSASPE